MKIVDYDTFVRMPAGTIFCPWTPFVTLEEPEIKVDTGEEYTSRNGEKKWRYTGTCRLMPTPIGEEGMFVGEVDPEFFYYDGDSNDASEYKMFLIYEEADLEAIKKIIDWAISGCHGDPNDCYIKGE